MNALGVDLGGTNARAAVVDDSGQVLASVKIALSERNPEAVVRVIAEASRDALRSAGVAVSAGGVAVAGQLRGETGVVANAPNLGWRDVAFGALLADALGHPVRLLNDLKAAAWGEFKAGAGRGVRDVWTMFVGTGIGSAIIANGQLVAGVQGVAGEFGHVKVVPDGRQCGCGQRGCLEAYAGGVHLLMQMNELYDSGRPTRLRELVGDDPSQLTPALLEEAALLGDPEAQQIYETAVNHLSLAVANQITVLNPARLLLGGGVLLHCHGMRQRIREGIERYTLATAREHLVVTDAALGDDAGLIGAALLALGR